MRCQILTSGDLSLWGLKVLCERTVDTHALWTLDAFRSHISTWCELRGSRSAIQVCETLRVGPDSHH